MYIRDRDQVSRIATTTMLASTLRSLMNSLHFTILIMLTNGPTLKLNQSLKGADFSVCVIVLRENQITMYFRLPFVLL